MAFKLPEQVQETTTTTGTGSYTLAGAVTGFRAFSNELASADTTIYTVYNAAVSPPVYETNYGTFTSPSTLSRVTLIKSTTGYAIDWPAGTKNVISGLPGILVQAIFDPAANGLVRSIAGALSIASVSANGLSLIAAADYAAMRALLDLEAGVDFNAYAARLADVAGVSPTADQFLGGTGLVLAMRTAAQLRTSLALGTLWDRNVPTRLRYVLASEQLITASETSYTGVTGLTNLSFPGVTDGSNKYEIVGQAYANDDQSHPSGVIIGLFVNAAGDLSGSPAWEGASGAFNSNGDAAAVIPSVELSPTASYKLSLAVKRESAQDYRLIAGGNTFLVIREVLD